MPDWNRDWGVSEWPGGCPPNSEVPEGAQGDQCSFLIVAVIVEGAIRLLVRQDSRGGPLHRLPRLGRREGEKRIQGVERARGLPGPVFPLRPNEAAGHLLRVNSVTKRRHRDGSYRCEGHVRHDRKLLSFPPISQMDQAFDVSHDGLPTFLTCLEHRAQGETAPGKSRIPLFREYGARWQRERSDDLVL